MHSLICLTADFGFYFTGNKPWKSDLVRLLSDHGVRMSGTSGVVRGDW